MRTLPQRNAMQDPAGFSSTSFAFPEDAAQEADNPILITEGFADKAAEGPEALLRVRLLDVDGCMDS